MADGIFPRSHGFFQFCHRFSRVSSRAGFRGWYPDWFTWKSTKNSPQQTFQAGLHPSDPIWWGEINICWNKKSSKSKFFQNISEHKVLVLTWFEHVFNNVVFWYHCIFISPPFLLHLGYWRCIGSSWNIVQFIYWALGESPDLDMTSLQTLMMWVVLKGPWLVVEKRDEQLPNYMGSIISQGSRIPINQPVFHGSCRSRVFITAHVKRTIFRPGGICQIANLIGRFTPPKTNMEPENGPLEKEIPIGNHHFQVPC